MSNVFPKFAANYLNCKPKGGDDHNDRLEPV